MNQPAIQIRITDGVLRGIVQVLKALAHFAEGGGGLLPFRHVAENAVQERFRLSRLAENHAFVAHPNQPAIAGNHPVFHGVLLVCLMHHGASAVFQMHAPEPQARLAQPFRRRVTEQRFDLWANKMPPARRPDFGGITHRRHAFDELPVFLLGVGQLRPRLGQLRVAFLDLLQHFVERFGEPADFIGLIAGHSQTVIVPGRHSFGDLHQAVNGIENRLLQPVRNCQRHQSRQNQTTDDYKSRIPEPLDFGV